MNINMEYILYFLIIIIIIVAVNKYYPKVLEFLKTNKPQPKSNPIIPSKKIFNGKSKCFDCEAQVNNYNKTPYNLIHPTKCFDCERQINQQYNGLRSNLGHSTKCFTCEN